jgi:hypothetical protein
VSGTDSEVDSGCKLGAKCTRFRRNSKAKTFIKSFGMYGMDDGSRTRDLCRDRKWYTCVRNGTQRSHDGSPESRHERVPR